MKTLSLYLAVQLFYQVEVLGLPQVIQGGYNPISKPVAPLPAVDKTNTGDADTVHGSNAHYPSVGDLLWISSVCNSNAGNAYDILSKRCSKVGVQAHCGKNMIFYRYAENFGFCGCDATTKVPLVQHSQNITSIDTYRCYYIYTQGWCEEGYWLEPDNEGARCTTNKCYQYGSSFGHPALASRDTIPEYVPLNSTGQCVQLFRPSHLCKQRNEIVSFVGVNKNATCTRSSICSIG